MTLHADLVATQALHGYSSRLILWRTGMAIAQRRHELTDRPIRLVETLQQTEQAIRIDPGDLAVFGHRVNSENGRRGRQDSRLRPRRPSRTARSREIRTES